MNIIEHLLYNLNWLLSYTTLYSIFHLNFTFVLFSFYRACTSCDALASPLQPLPPAGESWYQPLHTSHMPPNNSSAHQIYQCSSECSDHSRTSHSNAQHNQQPPSYQHVHNAHSHHHSHSHGNHGPGGNNSGNDTMRSESSQENGKTAGHRCHKTNRFPEIIENDQKSIATSSCTYEVLGEPRNCSECCSSSREGDTCSCSEGSCLYAEAGEPGMPPHIAATTQGLTAGAKILTQNN